MVGVLPELTTLSYAFSSLTAIWSLPINSALNDLTILQSYGLQIHE
jgi:hypothetical protein